MKTFLAIIGVLFLLFVVWFFGFKRGLGVNLLGNTPAKNPADCNPDNKGFTNDGKYNPDKCGTPAELECDPNRAGWNKAGFPDVNCGFGRIGNTERTTVATKPEITEFVSRFSKTATFSNDVVKLQRKLGVPATGFYDETTRKAFSQKLQSYITAHPNNFPTMAYCLKNWNLGVAIDCLFGYGIL